MHDDTRQANFTTSFEYANFKFDNNKLMTTSFSEGNPKQITPR